MGFKTSSLESMCELIVDCPHFTPMWTDSGVVVLRNQNIRNGELDLSSPSYTDEEGYLARIKRAVPQSGDIIFTREAPMGEVCVIPEGLKCCLGQRQVLLRPKPSIGSEYLYWALQSPFVKHQILWNEGTGTTVSNVRIPVLKSLKIPRNESSENDIGNLLSSLAKKSRINQYVNKTLEQMAQAIFKSWFVDFEPVKARIAAKRRWLGRQPGNEPASPVCYASELTPEIPQHDLETTMTLAAMEVISGKDEAQLSDLQAEQPEQYAELRATAKLFPSAMQDSELGEIPEGWSAPELREQVDVLRGFSYKGKGLSDSGTPMHNLNSILEGGGYKYPGIKYYSLEFKKKFEVVPGDVLVANTEQGHAHLLIGYGAAVPSFYETSIFSHHLYRVRPKSDSQINKEFLATLFKEPVFVKSVQGFANGTTVNMLPMAGIQMPIFVCPPKILAEKFSELVRPYIAMAENKYLQSQSLSSLRDTLLPKLLSGELSISDAESRVAEVEESADV